MTSQSANKPGECAHLLITCALCLLIAEAALAIAFGASGHYGSWWAFNPVIGLLLLIAFAGVRRVQRRSGVSKPDIPNRQRWLFLPLGFLVVALTLTALAFPTLDYDSLYYHLPAIATWHQTGAFEFPAQASLQQFYPYTWEAVCGLFFTPLLGDALVFLPNVFAWALFGLAVYGIVQCLGRPSLHAVSVTALALSLPLAVDQVNTMYVDLPLAACFMTALYFGLVFAQGGPVSSLALALLAAALIPGIKVSGIAYAGLAVLAVAMLALALRGPRNVAATLRPRKPLPLMTAVLFLAGLLLLAGFWYFRNWTLVSNPLGRVAVSIGDWVVFPGEMDREAVSGTTLLALFEITDPQDWKALIVASAYYLQVSGALVALLVPLGLWGLARTRGARVIAAVLATLLAATVFLYTITPYSGDNGSHGWQITPWIGQGFRYGLCAWGVACVLAGGIRLSGVGERILATAAALCVWLGVARVFFITAMQQAGHTQINVDDMRTVAIYFGGSVLATGLLAVLALSARGRMPAFSRKRGAALIVAFILFLPILTMLRDRQRIQRYGEICAVLATPELQGERVAYCLSHRPYIFYGPRYETYPLFLPPRDGEGESAWRARLLEAGATHVAIGPVPAGAETGDVVRWLSDTEHFTPLVTPDVHRAPQLYRLVDPS